MTFFVPAPRPQGYENETEAEYQKAQLNHAVPRSVTHATEEERRRSRPPLHTRICVYVALLENAMSCCDIDMLTIQRVALMDESICYGLDAALVFDRNTLTSKEVKDAIFDLKEAHLLDDCNWDHIRLRGRIFKAAMSYRWTPWGFSLWMLFEGLSGTCYNDKTEPSIDGVFVAGELEHISRYGNPYTMRWLRGEDSYRCYDVVNKPYPTAIIGRILVKRTHEHQPLDVPFGIMRYREIVPKLSVMRGLSPDGIMAENVFFEEDRYLGRYQVHKEEIVELDFAISLDIDYIDAIIRDMCVHARMINREVAGSYLELMRRHCDPFHDEAVFLKRINWHTIKSVTI